MPTSLPLSGRRIVVTRARTQAGALIELLTGSGADVVHLPVIEIVPPVSWESLDRVIDARYDWLIFTSVNGVQSFVSRLHLRATDFSAICETRIAAVGRATADELQTYGVEADAVPDRFTVRDLLPLLPVSQEGIRTAVVRAEEGRDELIEELRRRGGSVDLAIAYRTVAANYDVDALRQLIQQDAIDAVTFTSPSTVTHFFTPLDAEDRARLLARAKLVSIGPSTTEAVRDSVGRTPAEADTSTMRGLHDAVVAALATH